MLEWRGFLNTILHNNDVTVSVSGIALVELIKGRGFAHLSQPRAARVR